LASQKEAWNIWREQYLRDLDEKKHSELVKLMELEAIKRQEEVAKERELHQQTRSDMIMKYMAERVAPGVHDAASNKEAFGEWKEQYMHHEFVKREELTQEMMLGEAQRRREEEEKERQVHVESRSDMIMKYFSDRVAPGVHDVAMKKEGFGVWKEEYYTAQNKRDLIPNLYYLKWID
jgi:aconitase B